MYMNGNVLCADMVNLTPLPCIHSRMSAGAQPGKRKAEAAPQHQDTGVRSIVSALKNKAQRTAGRPVKWQPHKQG